MSKNINYLCPFEKKRLEEQERIDNLSKEKTLTVKAYYTREDYEMADKFEVLCMISEWEWQTSKMSLPILKDNYWKYAIYHIVDSSGNTYQFIEG